MVKVEQFCPPLASSSFHERTVVLYGIPVFLQSIGIHPQDLMVSQSRIPYASQFFLIHVFVVLYER
jgi:hypothetical protein